MLAMSLIRPLYYIEVSAYKPILTFYREVLNDKDCASFISVSAMHGTVFHIGYISIDIDSLYSKIASCCLPYYFLLLSYPTSIPSSLPPEESYHLLDDLDVLPGVYLNNLLPIFPSPAHHLYLRLCSNCSTSAGKREISKCYSVQTRLGTFKVVWV